MESTPTAVHSCPANWNAGMLKLMISSSPIGSGVTPKSSSGDVADQLAGRDVRDAGLGGGELDVGQLGVAVVEQRRSVGAGEAQALVDLRAEVDDGVGELVVHGDDVALGGAPALDGLRHAALAQRDLALLRHEGHRQVQRTAVVRRRCRTAPKSGYPAVRSISIVIVIVADSPGSSLNLRGSTVIVPASLSALVVNCCVRPLTFVATRVVVRRPGITGAFTDGRLRCTALTRIVAEGDEVRPPSRRTSGPRTRRR